MVPSAIVLIVIAVLAALAFRFSAKHGGSCEGCGGNCAACMDGKSAKQMYDEIKATEKAEKEHLTN
ncbi:MAG: FeoB-associated Cys-rich membrane protein [Eubacteriales bacterium]|jgi:hypothetical protein|nr:FeoB-associated Cys-rich membrane protein [Eubacteriales bacterium]